MIYFSNVWDLEEGLKEKDEVISARTAAVGLARASLAAKCRVLRLQLASLAEEARNETPPRPLLARLGSRS